MPDVVDVIHQSAHAFEAEAECEAGINRRINSARPKNIRMDHSRAAELYPASAFAWTAALTVDLTGSVTAKAREIELGRRLGEREVRRPKSRDSVGAIHVFHISCSFWPITRARMSVVPPAENGTTMVTGRDG